MIQSFPVRDFDLAATLNSGQAFRWHQDREGWVGVIGRHWVRLQANEFSLIGETAEPVKNWAWLTHYLQLDLDLEQVLQSFPQDEPMRAAVAACRGLRLLRQEPWECLASFILSSTKQIVQIRQIISRLCECYGEPVVVPTGSPTWHTFPLAVRLAGESEAELRQCKMGFRAPYLLTAAQEVAGGQLNLAHLAQMPVETARARLMDLPGVGRKIADCVLLFAYGFPTAFPVDVWVMKALRKLYFPRRRASVRRLHDFAGTYFGPHGGYAQQYLFHYARVKSVAMRVP